MKMILRPKLPRRNFLRSTAAAVLGATIADSLRLSAADAVPSGTGRRIGFADLYRDTYHANFFLQALRGPRQSRGFTVAGATATRIPESRAWAEKNKVPFFEDAAALNSAVDFFMVLAPSNPEVHLELCRRVFPFRKPTYVDKTFPPDFAAAPGIFAPAHAHGTPTQTTSGLRYTKVADGAA